MTGKLINLSRGREDEKSNFSIAEDRQLESLLQKPISPLGEGHLPVCWVLYSLQLHFSSPHLLSLLPFPT